MIRSIQRTPSVAAFLATAALLVATAGPALAHHPLGGSAMETFSHGLLSGIGHPLLGFDHLFFIVAVGIAALFTGAPARATLCFIGGMLAGVGLIVGGIALPFVEPAIAISLLVLGGLIATGTALSLPVAAVVFAGLGLFHGWAFGEALAGQEGGAALQVLIGYLVGLGVTQWVVAMLSGLALVKIWNVATAADMPARLSGATVAGVGLYLVLEAVEGPALAALGLAA